MDDTFNGGASSLLYNDQQEQRGPALVVMWSRGEPDRMGEIILVPPNRSGWVLGRRSDPAPSRLGLYQQRPGRNIPTGELGSRRLSRQQLRLRRDDSSLYVDNIGKLAMKINTRNAENGRLQPGDLLELDRELMMLCVSRPEQLPNTAAHHPFGQPDEFGIVGETPETWHLREQIRFCAESGSHVLIQGPSGTGKELVAQAIHHLSCPRRTLVSRNAATFPEGILDAELFGNLRDYPNPGMMDRPGAIGAADQSTLFLDEIGEISHKMQAHLLRVLDSGEYQRLGEASARTARFRLVGATNRDLTSLKHDFLARFPLRISLSGLDTRRADIPLLARHLLTRLRADNPTLFSGDTPRLHPDLVRALVQRNYRTHAREIMRLMWDAVKHWHATGGKYLILPPGVTEMEPPAPRKPNELTREDILAAYRRFGGVQGPVPAYLGLRDRFQLLRLEKKLGITRADRDAAVSN